jgi:hypothetical protein
MKKSLILVGISTVTAVISLIAVVGFLPDYINEVSWKYVWGWFGGSLSFMFITKWEL